MAGQSVGNRNYKWGSAVRIMKREKNLSPLNLSRMAMISYQTAKRYLDDMVYLGWVEKYRSQYRSNVIANIYQWVGGDDDETD